MGWGCLTVASAAKSSCSLEPVAPPPDWLRAKGHYCLASDVMLSPLNSGFGQKAATEVVCYCSTVNYQLETPRQPLGLEIDNAQCFEMCYVIHASVQCKFPMVDHCLARVSCVVPKKLG